MTTNHRKEPFRYSFKEPIPFNLYIVSINGIPAPTKPIKAFMHNISQSGCRLWMPLALNVDTHQIRISMNLVLHEEPLCLEGTLRWGLEEADNHYYGVQLEIAEHDREQLPRELRLLAGQNKIIVK
ncbi:PilZ domain-containing protein [Paenibacillus monticola]|uniref:PilZ domain-containing protein n=1 Tax=Paenibacillus monticola TaxID=2666075 RepID=A0A7X2H2A3_9BACL|nr:PilZ domain-containing protein [Paenibacillus monticola]MRN52289.1 PilZ domain-containing protein [Paenibacillus monticola]